MIFPKKVAMAINTSLPVEIWSMVKKMNFPDDCEVHLIHIFRMYNYGDGLSFNVAFPYLEHQEELSSAVIAELQSLSSKILPEGFKGKKVYECLFDYSPKEKMLKYIEDQNIEMVIVGTRIRRGLFESSFASFLCRRASSAVLVVR